MRESEARLQAILDTAVCGVITIDDRGVIETANPACADLFGYSCDELVGQNVSILMSTPYRNEHDGYLARFLETGEERIIGVGREVEARRKDGSEFPVRLSVSEFEVHGQRRFAGIVEDISDRRHAENELRNRVLQQETVAQLGILALSELDVDALMDTITSRVASTLEVEFVKILELTDDGKTLLLRAGVGWKDGLVGKAHVDAASDYQAGFTLEHGDPVVVEDLRREARFSGPSLLVDHGVVSGMSVVILGEHRPWGVFGVHTTEPRRFRTEDVHFLQSVANLVAEAIGRRDSRERLVQQENLVRLGELAGVVAHEVKNTQAGVAGALRIIGTRLPEGSEDQHVIREMLSRLESLNRFMGDVLNFASPKMPSLAVLPVDLLLEDIVSFAENDARFKNLKLSLDCEKLRVPLDLEMIRPVILNLLINAAEAMGHYGEISIRAEYCTISRCGRCCRISVSDNGPGIPKDLRERVFEPFFSTKHRGSGLGLALAKRVAGLHEGRVSLESPEDGGTRVVLEIPMGKNA